MTRDELAMYEHFRWHLIDGHWHDDCRWCLQRRLYGGTGTEPEVAATP